MVVFFVCCLSHVALATLKASVQVIVPLVAFMMVVISVVEAFDSSCETLMKMVHPLLPGKLPFIPLPKAKHVFLPTDRRRPSSYPCSCLQMSD